jgi:hypothetical protein
MHVSVLLFALSRAAVAQAVSTDALLGHEHALRLGDAGFADFTPAPFALDAELTDWSFGTLQSNFPTEVLCQRQGDVSPRSANLGTLSSQVVAGFALAGPDGATAYRVVVNNAGPPPNPVLEFAKVHCGDAARTELGAVTAGPATALGDINPLFLDRKVGLAGPGGRVCFPLRERAGEDVLGCFLPEAAPIGVERWLTPAQLDAALAPPGGFAAAFPVLADYTRVGWTMSSAVFVPDGRVFALVTLTWRHATSAGVTWARQWLVTQASAGAPVLARTRALDASQFAGQALPTREDFEHPAFRAQRLFFHPPTNTVLAWPRGGLNLVYDLKAVGFPLLGGQDFGVFDVASEGQGRLDVTWEVASTAVDPRVHPTQQFAQCFVAGGQLLCGFFEHFSNGSDAARWRTLLLDRSGADFDRDGLTGAQELAAGTSDFDADSDDDGAGDGEEVESARTDPRDAGSGAASSPGAGIGFGYTNFIQERLPLRTVDLNPVESRLLCGEGRCVDRAGRVVFSSDAGRPLFVDPSGTTFVWRSPDGLYSQRLDGGATRLLTAAELAAQVGASVDRFAVSDDGRVFPLGGAVPVVLEGGQVRQLWDPADACQAPRQVCVDGGRPFDAVVGARVLAWDAPRERLLLAFQSKLDQRVLALSLDGGTVSVLRRGLELPPNIVSETIGGQLSLYHSGALPSALTQLGSGAFFGDWGLGSGLFTGSVRALPLDRGSLETPHGAGWAGAAVTNDPFDTDAFDGVNELVPMRAVLEPGDVLTWWGGLGHAAAPTVVPVHLAKVGRRGGLLRFKPGLPGFLSPTALARAPGGALCAVARESVGGPAVLFEFLAPGADGVPTQRVTRAVDGVVDCAYSADGVLHFLADSPLRLGRIEGGAVVKELSLSGAGQPAHLVPAVDGGWYVTLRDAPLRCVDADLGTAEPSTLSVLALAPSKSGALWAIGGGGELLRLNPDGLCSSRVGVEATGASLSALESARLGARVTALAANVAERADGRVVLQGTAWTDPAGQVPGALLYFFNPETKKTGLLNYDDLSGGLAVVPGADWCDPWGEGLPPAEQTCLVAPTGVPPRPVEALDSGVPGSDAGATPGPAPQGCGCASAPFSWAWLVFVLPGLLRGRRRR